MKQLPIIFVLFFLFSFCLGANAKSNSSNKNTSLIYFQNCIVLAGSQSSSENIEFYQQRTDIDSSLANKDSSSTITQYVGEKVLLLLKDGREVECIIESEDDKNLYLSIFRNSNKIETQISKDEIQTINTKKSKAKRFEHNQNIRVAINGGYSYQTAKVAESVPDDFKEYVGKLKSGYHFGGDISYFFTDRLGMGLRYNLFKTSNSMSNIYVEDASGHKTFGSLSDELTILFIGPTFSTRVFTSNKNNAFLANLSFGYIGYSNNKVIVEEYKMTSKAMGLAFDIGYDIGLTENLSLGLQISYTSGILTEYDWDDGTTVETISLEKDEYESLNRIDFSVGLRFNL